MRALASSPSSGEFEMLAALRMAHAISGNDKSPARIKRHFPKRTTVAELTTLLQGASGTYVHAASSKYSLTTAGLARARQHKPRSYSINVT